MGQADLWSEGGQATSFSNANALGTALPCLAASAASAAFVASVAGADFMQGQLSDLI